MAGEERRINFRLQSYWDQLRGDRPYPSESEINPDDIGDIWPSCYLVHRFKRDGKYIYKYEYLGKELVEAYGDDMNGREVYEELVDAVHTQEVIHHFRQVVQSGHPVTLEGEFTNQAQMHIKYRQALMPIGDGNAQDPGTVAYILGGMRWRAF